MKTEYVTPDDLAFIQQDKGSICVSVIVPTHPLSPERRTDRLKIEKTLARAKEYLEFKYRKMAARELIQQLDELYNEHDLNHSAEGVGFFVSGHVKKLVHFFFPVTEKIIVDTSFAARDLLYEHYYSSPYFVLLLTGNTSKLYIAKINRLEEIVDAHFPLKYEEEYEYNKPSRGSSYVGHTFLKEFEKDKSQLEDIRYKDFMHKTGERLSTYLFDDAPLVVTGSQKDLSVFKKAAKHLADIEICGNYAETPVTELGELTWKACKLVFNRRKDELVSKFKETGLQHAVTGIYEIWKAAKEGRGLTLLVEKDYSLPGFLRKGDDYNLYLHVPDEPHDILPDAIEAIIKTVLEKNGDVLIVENEALEEFQRVALMTRY
jgi:hypothetical protein